MGSFITCVRTPETRRGGRPPVVFPSSISLETRRSSTTNGLETRSISCSTRHSSNPSMVLPSEYGGSRLTDDYYELPVTGAAGGNETGGCHGSCTPIDDYEEGELVIDASDLNGMVFAALNQTNQAHVFPSGRKTTANVTPLSIGPEPLYDSYSEEPTDTEERADWYTEEPDVAEGYTSVGGEESSSFNVGPTGSKFYCQKLGIMGAVPAGAVKQDTQITLTKSDPFFSRLEPAPGDICSKVYGVTVSDEILPKAMSLEVPYAQSARRQKNTFRRLRVFVSDATSSGAVNFANNCSSKEFVITQKSVCVFVTKSCRFVLVEDDVSIKYVSLGVYGKFFPAVGILTTTVILQEDSNKISDKNIGKGSLVSQATLRIMENVDDMTLAVKNVQRPWYLTSKASSLLDTSYLWDEQKRCEKFSFEVEQHPDAHQAWPFFTADVETDHGGYVTTVQVMHDVTELISPGLVSRPHFPTEETSAAAYTCTKPPRGARQAAPTQAAPLAQPEPDQDSSLDGSSMLPKAVDSFSSAYISDGRNAAETHPKTYIAPRNAVRNTVTIDGDHAEPRENQQITNRADQESNQADKQSGQQAPHGPLNPHTSPPANPVLHFGASKPITTFQIATKPADLSRRSLPSTPKEKPEVRKGQLRLDDVTMEELIQSLDDRGRWNEMEHHLGLVTSHGARQLLLLWETRDEPISQLLPLVRRVPEATRLLTLATKRVLEPAN